MIVTPSPDGIQARLDCFDDRLDDNTEAIRELIHTLRTDTADRDAIRMLRTKVREQEKVIQHQAAEIRRLKAKNAVSAQAQQHPALRTPAGAFEAASRAGLPGAFEQPLGLTHFQSRQSG